MGEPPDPGNQQPPWRKGEKNQAGGMQRCWYRTALQLLCRPHRCGHLPVFYSLQSGPCYLLSGETSCNGVWQSHHVFDWKCSTGQWWLLYSIIVIIIIIILTVFISIYRLIYLTILKVSDFMRRIYVVTVIVSFSRTPWASMFSASPPLNSFFTWYPLRYKAC